ncbi:MAG: ATP-binding protein [Verrucomicrobiota bacterium]
MPRSQPPLLLLRLFLGASVTAMTALLTGFAATETPRVITNLHELTLAAANNQQTIGDIDLEVTICAASRPQLGVLIVQDASGTELLQLGALPRSFQPGERLRIQQPSCFLRRRETGVQLSIPPVVMNDGLHPWVGKTNVIALRAGMIPIRVEWFNYWRYFGLDVLMAAPGAPSSSIPSSNLWHAVASESGPPQFAPGLQFESYEGSWEMMPDFDLLPPKTTGIVTNFDLNARAREERVGIRYSGYLQVPRDGHYQFTIWSDDGGLLFFGPPDIAMANLGQITPPSPPPCELLTRFHSVTERRWITVEGRVSFVMHNGIGTRFYLGTDRHSITVNLADAGGLDLASLQNSRIRISGVGRAVTAADQSLILGRLAVASITNLVVLEPALKGGKPTLPLTSVAQVQGLAIDEARKALPVRIRGTVTGGVNTSQERWMSFQDDTRGIFVRFNAVSNAAPAFGELWELEGVSSAGDFAPIIVADQMTRLGEGFLPVPVTPSWPELLNGSRDVQWAELTGLVTDVRSNTITLHLPEGRLQVELEGLFETELKPFQKSVVRIRGVLYAVWNATTREVSVGQVKLRNPAISMAAPAPADPFDAVLRTPRELLLFDAQASAFRPVKVRGQIIYTDANKLFLQADDAGLRLLPMGKPEVQPGDLVDVVGYPDLGRTELVLREALLKRSGTAPLPAPKILTESAPAQLNLNSTRVHVEGKLLGWHTEEGGPVLEMQAGARLFLARLAAGNSTPLPLRPGSRLALEGVYVGRNQSQSPGVDNESFELLLNSLTDIAVLSQPSWWTLPRLLVVLTVLLVILIFTVVWNTQLRRLVEYRTNQLQHEIRERERLERQAALESERSRIARDLHDDLGASLTEISVLASTGQLPHAGNTNQSGLFQSISTRARSLIAALDVIVWAVDPEDNSLQSFADYLTGYTNDFFSHTQIACRFKVPVSLPSITLEGRVRHDLLMVVKEALNNIVRHAEATELEFRLAVVDGRLEIDIADNGKGIEAGAHSGGHGLKNLSSRLNKLGGQCTIAPRPTGGTLIQIRLPFTIAEAVPTLVAKH